MKTKKVLKQQAFALYILAGGLAITVFLIPVYSFTLMLTAAVVAYFAIVASNRSDALPVDEPDEGTIVFANVSQRRFSEKNSY